MLLYYNDSKFCGFRGTPQSITLEREGNILANNRIQLTIAGVTIAVSTPEEEAYVTRIAESVNRDMQTLLVETKASVTSAALLLAVDYMDRFQKANRSATNMRTQIKGYLADAANAKLLFDEEKKRSDNYAKEIANLKNKIEQLSSVASNYSSAPKREEIDSLINERNNLQAKLEEVSRSASAAPKDDSEYRHLLKEQSEHLERIGVQSEQISNLEQQLRSKQEEVEHLLKELKTLEDMITEDMVSNSESAEDLVSGEQQALLIPGPPMPPPVKTAAYEPTIFEEAYDNSVPPLFRTDPAGDVSYDIDEMPNLNWTDNL